MQRSGQHHAAYLDLRTGGVLGVWNLESQKNNKTAGQGGDGHLSPRAHDEQERKL